MDEVMREPALANDARLQVLGRRNTNGEGHEQ